MLEWARSTVGKTSKPRRRSKLHNETTRETRERLTEETA